MKKILFSTFLLCLSVAAFGQSYDHYGKKIKSKGAQPLSSIENKTDFSDKAVKIEGVVESVCQNMGCWMTLKKSDGTTMTVKFKDYAFFVPKDIAGKKVILEGVPSVKTVSVAEQKHFLEDAHKPQEEIDKITQDKVDLTFLATGVLIPKN